MNAVARWLITSLVRNTLSWVGLAAVVLVVGAPLRYARRGFDFTDEGFYALWLHDPFAFPSAVTLFGFVYHPMYVLTGGDLGLLRQVNNAATFVLAMVLAWVLLRSIAPDAARDRLSALSAAAGVATTSLIVFDSWLLTPNYNVLVVQALLVFGIGVVLLSKATVAMTALGAIHVGVGGWLTFMAKPTAAAALAASFLLYALLSKHRRRWTVATAALAAVGLLLATAFVIDGSVGAFAQRLISGVRVQEALQSGHTWGEAFRWDAFYLSSRAELAFRLLFVLALVTAWGAWGSSRVESLVAATGSVLTFAFVALLALPGLSWEVALGRFGGLVIMAPVLAAIVSLLLFVRLGYVKAVSLSHVRMALLFLALPHISAFGTNTNYWRAATSAGIFWVIAGLILTVPVLQHRRSYQPIIPLVLVAQLVTALLMHSAIERPYRQPSPLYTQNTAVPEVASDRGLRMSEDYASYIHSAVSTARSGGFAAGTPVIDLSGQSPGLLYFMGATSPGVAWTLGGYEGSEAFVTEAWNDVPCDVLASAWVLREPQGPRSIGDHVLREVGATFPDSYVPVGTWRTAPGAGGFSERREQHLYMPRSEHGTLASCRNIRE